MLCNGTDIHTPMLLVVVNVEPVRAKRDVGLEGWLEAGNGLDGARRDFLVREMPVLAEMFARG